MKIKALEWFGVITAISYSMMVALNVGVEFIGFLLLLISALSIGTPRALNPEATAASGLKTPVAMSRRMKRASPRIVATCRVRLNPRPPTPTRSVSKPTTSMVAAASTWSSSCTSIRTCR